MPNAFNFSASPFDCLTQEQQRLVRDHVDVAYFPKGTVILEVGAQPTHLWVVINDPAPDGLGRGRGGGQLRPS